ncbi:hypothetical protein OGAPHI_001078 [Ogataea philodendri]|uniref:Small ribosomal subunit protein uS5m n=1 Tax=Ogataea philodendri TaxID=1378263 RepID=A0A9P8T8R2_9ASCO|nr:uncharacterized protein OGAPHI_001078 [Ogataea philodendri]KAH3670563.1 hypothetical protein OGAPHI_001078 [Ogataea philodendri]
MFRRLFSTSRLALNVKTSELDPKKLKHMQYLLQYYEPKVVESIMLAESSIKKEHFDNRKIAAVPFGPHYLDDLTRKDPYFDHLPEEKYRDFLKVRQLNKPDYPPGHKGDIAQFLGDEEGNEMSMIMQDLVMSTGFSEEYISKLRSKTLIIKSVRNQTSKGKISSFYALVCVGDGNGMLGVGEAKDRDDNVMAVFKAHWQAVKNMAKVPLLEDRTIYGNIEHKYVSTVVHLRSAPPGFGLKCNPMIFELARCAGIKDLGAKVYRSRNKMNVIKCVTEALVNQRSISEIAAERGKKVVDLRGISSKIRASSASHLDRSAVLKISPIIIRASARSTALETSIDLSYRTESTTSRMVDEISIWEPFHAAAMILPMSNFSISATASSEGISSLGVSFLSSFLSAGASSCSVVSCSAFCICSRFSVILASSCIVLWASKALLMVLKVSLMIPPFSFKEPIHPPNPKNDLCDFRKMLALTM